MADPVRLITERLQGFVDCVDRQRMVELRRFLLSVPLGQIIIPQVVSDADLH
jgi:hypothetical protein